MSEKNLRILVVDDTSLYRTILRNIISNIPGIEVVGTAYNGKIALEQIKTLNPDVVTLDIDMPVMDGLTTLSNIKQFEDGPFVIMVSSLTKDGAEITLKALHLGAFDFITKPESSNFQLSIKELSLQLSSIMKAIINKKSVHDRLIGAKSYEFEDTSISAKHVQAKSIKSFEFRTPEEDKGQINIVAIGVSTGGPNALAEVLTGLPENLNVPMVVVQHMPPVFTKALADSLDKKSSLKVVEGYSGLALEEGTVYIAPGGKQMKIILQKDTNKPGIETTDDPPENFSKPSVSYLFRSIAEIFADRSLGIIMTGMGSDGISGLRKMKETGATVVAQDEASCVVYGMPGEAVKAGVVDKIVPLQDIPNEIVHYVNNSNYYNK